jgi:hypothetical protein
MPSAAVAVPAGASLIGSAMAGRSAEKAANTSANAQLEAARIAAEAQRFRPVGITTRFGTSQFTMDPEGYLQSAGYTASPEITALQDRLSALYGDALSQAEQQQAFQPQITQQAQGLFGLGQGYLSESPEAARQRIFNQLQETRLPAQMREEQRLGAGVFGRGRAGLNIGSMGQPELFALGQAREEQRMRDALAAEQQAQQQVEFGRGLLGSGLGLQEAGLGLQTSAFGPFQTQFGLAQLLEQSAQQPLDIGAQLGGRAATAGANVGQTLLQGGLGAAQTRLQGSLVGPSLMANNLASFGQQYIQGQQQQDLLRQLQMSNPANIYSNTNQFALASQAGQYGTT